jgi:hypothetical protein
LYLTSLYWGVKLFINAQTSNYPRPVVFFCGRSFGQPDSDPSKIIISDKYKNDFDLLRKTLQKNYPSLYRFKDKEVINNFLDSCYNSLNQQTDDLKFYATIKKVLSYIEDGHLSCSPSKKLRTIFEEQWQYFPLSLFFLKDKAYNLCENTSIPKGSEIISINNNPVQKIRQNLIQYIVSDGKIETGKNHVLNNTFWFYYNLVYGQQQSFIIRFRALNGKTESRDIPPKFRKDMECNTTAVVKNEKLLQFSYPEKNTALITIKSFSYFRLTESKEDFGAFVDSAFGDIGNKQVKNLIIDIRENGGGADVYGSYLYSFLTGKTFKYYLKLETSERELPVADHPNLSIQKPVENPYKGKVFILINGLTFSAAAEFCSIVRSNNRGKFIGEETGGTYYGNTSGNFVDTVLPNTQITVSLPTTRYSMAVKEAAYKDRGIIPDYIINPTISDIIHKKNVQLDVAIKLAGKK